MALTYKFASGLGLIYVVIVLITSGLGARLSDPKILLPYHSSYVTNFTLHINLSAEESQMPDSCYKWHSSQPEVATVQLINSSDAECSDRAMVSAVSKTPHRKTSMVFAENKVTGELLRCIVIVDSIARIEIETTARVLYLEDSPEELIIRGYDDEGNAFTNLHGLEFEWSLQSHTGADVENMVDAHNILRILRFSESHYTTPSHIERLESRGVQGDMILVEGIRTGSARVTAKIRDGAYKKVSPTEVRIMVIANLMVSPSEAYILKSADVRYKVLLLKQNTITTITMPSTQFYLEVVEKDVCTLNEKTSIATALDMGSTEIKLMDKNIKMTDSFHHPSAMLHVVSPSYLAFVVWPDRKWVLETGRVYDVVIEVYDKDSHKIYPSNNVIIKAQFPKEYFKVLFSTTNGTYHRVQTLKKGRTDIEGALSTIIKSDGSEFAITPSLKQSQEVDIFDPITVEPPILFFPWDPVSQANHQYPLKATGGSGEYVWSSSKIIVSTVNVKGEITTGYVGSTNVTAADLKNQAHFGTSSIHVLPPSDMQFKPYYVEAVVGSILELPLAVYAIYDGVKYTIQDCRKMDLNLSFSDSSIFEHIKGFVRLQEGSCTVVKVEALQQGHTEIKVSYYHGDIQLQSSVTIAAYNPLEPVDPEELAVVTVASSKDVTFIGGPQAWVLDSSKFFQILSSQKNEVVGVEQVAAFGTQRSSHIFRVVCTDFGDQTLTLQVGNGKTAKNQHPAMEERTIRFSCAQPVELHLHPLVSYPQERLPPCPVARESHQPIPVPCHKDLDIQVIVTDVSGRKFDNFSSLEIDWSVSDESLSSTPTASSLSTEITSAYGRMLVTALQSLHLKKIPGELVVTATISRYSQSQLRNMGTSISSQISPKISKSLELSLVELASLSPDVISVFNHPSNKVIMAISDGSGYFHMQQGKMGVTELKYNDNSKEIQVVPLGDGSQTVTIYDLCIDMPEPMTATIFVSGVGSVQLFVMDKVEEGNDMIARVKVLDIKGEPLLASFFSLMGLKLRPASDIISTRSHIHKSTDQFTATFIVHGSNVGHTSLKAVVQLPSGTSVYSQSRPVEVFPPLRLSPKNITLIIGAVFQVLSRGGPQPQSTVEYSISNSRIVSVSSSGLLDAQELGMTTVHGKAVGQDPETGETIVYSEDDAVVNVVVLAGIRIHSPLTRLQTGTKMPVYALGLTEQETPFSFGSALPPLHFQWSVNIDKDIVKLQSVFDKSGIVASPANNFATQLAAMEAGQVTLKLKVTPPKWTKVQIMDNAVLTDEIQIQVFDKLAVISPSLCDGKILITPNTEAIIKTNRDSVAKVSMRVVSFAQTPPVVSIKDSNQIVSGSVTGEASIYITSEEEFRTNQTLVLLVKVRPVSYLMINSDTKLRAQPDQMTAIPIGTTLYFTISYHDDVGEQFYATNLEMRHRCSRYDLVQMAVGMENNTLVLKAADVGQTILKVWDRSNPWLADYINIPVDYAIEPAQVTVTLGEIVCFETSVLSEKGYRGLWSSRGRTITIDHTSGIATAVMVGKSSVIYNVSSDVSTHTEITVEPVKQVLLESTMQALTNTQHRNKGYTVTVLLDSDGQIKGDNCSAQVAEEMYRPTSLPFRCQLELASQSGEISMADLFHATAMFNAMTGKFACQIVPKESPYLSQQTSTLSSEIILNVIVPQQEGQPEIAAQPMVFDFYPAFFVHNAEVHLTTMTPLSSVRVSTVPSLIGQIEAIISDSSILEALTPEKDTQTGSVLLYPIRLMDTIALWERENLNAYVELVCQPTGQRVKVPVFIRLIGQKPDYIALPGYSSRESGWGTLIHVIFSNYQSWLFILFLIVCTAIAVVIGYHVVIGPRYKTTANPTAFLSPAGAAPMAQFSPGGTPPAYTPYTYSKSPSNTTLWSTGYGPLDSTSPIRRSPYQRSSP
ncbi:hypothetical protein ScPMuIL_015029 [Solemya velum]